MSTNTENSGDSRRIPAGFFPPFAVFPLGLIIGLGAWWLASYVPVEKFDLPRAHDSVVLQIQPVGEWMESDKGFLGLKVAVSGPDLPVDQYLRFTEGSQRIHAVARITWLDGEGLAVAVPTEKPFKDDC